MQVSLSFFQSDGIHIVRIGRAHIDGDSQTFDHPKCSNSLVMIVSFIIFYTTQYMVRFVDDESKSKRGGQGMEISHWPRVNVPDRPMQQNGFDCGGF